MDHEPRTRPFLRSIAAFVGFAVAISGIGLILTAPPASAVPKPCDPETQECPDPTDQPIPYQPAGSGLGYSLDARAGGWKNAWYSRDDKQTKQWDVETYDPNYVNPTKFSATFQRQCIDETDWNNELNLGMDTVNTYRWTVDGVVKALRTCSLTKLELQGQGIHDVKLEVRNPSNVVLVSKSRTVLVKDKLVVLLGDSAASGEGSPEQNRSTNQEWGTWIDRRCHRSSHAAVPKAVQEMEAADPYTTITFLNFACSGATIERWIDEEGSGVLGPYIGIEHPAGVDPANVSTYLPSQVDQLDVALSRRFRKQVPGVTPIRSVDKLFISGGINDLQFSKLALVCVLYEDCVNKTSSQYGAGSTNVANVLKGFANEIPGSYAKLDQALLGRDIVTDERYAMQYPDAFSASNGALCSSMLGDVLPWSSVFFIVVVLSALLPLLHIIAGPLAVVIDLAILALGPIVEAATGINDVWGVLADGLTGDLEWGANEIAWMYGTAMPALDKAVQDGATAGDFTFVDDIAARFKHHGYCASDNWIVRASQASFRQGPWNFVSKPIGFYTDSSGPHLGGLGIHALTKGLMHPTPSGYTAIKDQLLVTQVDRDERTEPLFEDLRNHAPVATSDSFTLNLATDTQLDTGFGAGVLINDLDQDGDELRSILAQGPSHGTATLSTDGHLVYTPTAGYTGPDSIYYWASDGGLQSGSTAKVTINVSNPRDPGSGFEWTFPTGDERPVAVRGQAGTVFPICAGCGGLVLRTAEPLPQYGTISFLPNLGDGWTATYTATQDERVTLVDSFDVVAGTMVGDVFTELHRATVDVEILPYLR